VWYLAGHVVFNTYWSGCYLTLSDPSECVYKSNIHIRCVFIRFLLLVGEVTCEPTHDVNNVCVDDACCEQVTASDPVLQVHRDLAVIRDLVVLVAIKGFEDSKVICMFIDIAYMAKASLK